MKHRTWFAVATAALLLLTVAGCGKSKSSSKEGTDKTITIMASGVKDGNNGIFLRNFKKEVEKEYKGYTVETTLLPDDQYNTALKSKLSTGQSPDIFLVQPKKAGANSVEEMAKAGYISDLSKLSHWKNLTTQAKTDMSYKNKPYAVSSNLSVLGTYYNKDIFKKYNLSVPTTWNQFLDVCATLKDKGVTPIVMGDKDSFMLQFGLYQIAANQVYPDNPKFDDQLYTGKTKLTDPAWIKTLTMYKTLYDKGYVTKNSLGLGQTQSQQSFVDQKAAMTFDGDFSYSALKNAKFGLGLFALPGNNTGKTYVAAAIGMGFAISPKSKNKAMLMKVFNEMTDGKSDLFNAWAKSATSFSTYKGYEIKNPVFDDIRPALEAGRSFYYSNQAWPSGTETEMEAKFSEMIGTKKLTPTQVAQAMQKKFTELSN